MNETTIAILITVFLAFLIPVVIIGLSAILGPQKPNPDKLSTYEAGVVSAVGTARERFSVKFYLIAIMFILFDVEGVFLYPWAVNFRSLGLLGLMEMFVFIAILVAGFAYAWRKGALQWE